MIRIALQCLVRLRVSSMRFSIRQKQSELRAWHSRTEIASANDVHCELLSALCPSNSDELPVNRLHDFDFRCMNTIHHIKAPRYRQKINFTNSSKTISITCYFRFMRLQIVTCESTSDFWQFISVLFHLLAFRIWFHFLHRPFSRFLIRRSQIALVSTDKKALTITDK
jgi:hypothetical protein